MLSEAGAAAAVMLVMAYAFVWGLRRGSVACLAVCAPALLEKSARRGGGWRQGVRWAVVFNAPRIILLTLFGALAGALAYMAWEGGGAPGSFAGAGALALIASAAYFGAGAVLAGYGFYAFATALDERADVIEGRSGDPCRGDCPAAKERALLPTPSGAGMVAARRFLPRSKDEGFLAAWGLLLGFACLGETVVAVETVLVGGAIGGLAGGLAPAMALGAAAMFLFAVGAALPVVLVAGLCARAVERDRRVMLQLKLRMFGAGAMMVIGLLLCHLFLPALLAAL